MAGPYLSGRFDEEFLRLPQEVPIATMQDNQRYFPVRTNDGQLMNYFITVANIASREPERVRDGNERVVRPRLADAAFFWDTDRKERLEARFAALKSRDASRRSWARWPTRALARDACRSASLKTSGGNAELAARAAKLSKCDLLSAMVGEFPELQGLMGKYYAQLDGENPEVASALEEQYWPRFAGDKLPATKTGIALSVADKLDTIAGIFSIGQKPIRHQRSVRSASRGPRHPAHDHGAPARYGSASARRCSRFVTAGRRRPRTSARTSGVI